MGGDGLCAQVAWLDLEPALAAGLFVGSSGELRVLRPAGIAYGDPMDLGDLVGSLVGAHVNGERGPASRASTRLACSVPHRRPAGRGYGERHRHDQPGGEGDVCPGQTDAGGDEADDQCAERGP